MEQIKVDALKKLAHPVRLAIIETLKAKACSVTALAQALALEPSVIAVQVAELRRAGYVSSRQELGVSVYGVKEPLVVEIVDRLLRLARRRLEQETALLHYLSKEERKTT